MVSARESRVDDRDQAQRMVDALVERARTLTDEERLRLARARAAIDESFHAGAWRAASEMLSVRAVLYATAWQRIGPAFVPERLVALVHMGHEADADELREWHDVARLVRYSHRFRLKYAYRDTPVHSISPSANQNPKMRPSSGTSAKFMP